MISNRHGKHLEIQCILLLWSCSDCQSKADSECQSPSVQFPDTAMHIDGKNLKYVKSFTYLGSKMDANSKITNQIAKATSAFRNGMREIKLDTKIWVYRVSNADLLTKCNIGEIETFPMQPKTSLGWSCCKDG